MVSLIWQKNGSNQSLQKQVPIPIDITFSCICVSYWMMMDKDCKQLMDLDGWPFKGSGYGKNTHRGLEYSFNIHDIYVNSKCWRSALSYSIISNAFKTLTFQFLILSSEKIHLGWMYRMYLNDSRVHSFISQDDKEFY